MSLERSDLAKKNRHVRPCNVKLVPVVCVARPSTAEFIGNDDEDGGSNIDDPDPVPNALPSLALPTTAAS
ncbi:hypothetical protein ColTof3_14649 [Colletotrichum tofieldiae]|nr:hypothetical protein ColTof3_14649 [Colletotrichum tofieldiae]